MTTGISFHHASVTRIRASLTTDNTYGDQARDWAHATETTMTGGRLLPMLGGEDTVDRAQLTRRWLYFAPPDADWVSTDRLRWNDTDYEIDGSVRLWSSPTGRLAHLEIDLLRVEG